MFYRGIASQTGKVFEHHVKRQNHMFCYVVLFYYINLSVKSTVVDADHVFHMGMWSGILSLVFTFLM